MPLFVIARLSLSRTIFIVTIFDSLIDAAVFGTQPFATLGNDALATTIMLILVRFVDLCK